MNAILAPIGPDGTQLILGMLEDITDRKLVEERAGEGEERFRVIAEQSMLGILIFQDNAIRFVNQAVSDMNGYSIEEMANWDGSDLCPRDSTRTIWRSSPSKGERNKPETPSALSHYSYRIFDKSGGIALGRAVFAQHRVRPAHGRPGHLHRCQRAQAGGRIASVSCR